MIELSTGNCEKCMIIIMHFIVCCARRTGMVNGINGGNGKKIERSTQWDNKITLFVLLLYAYCYMNERRNNKHKNGEWAEGNI